MRLPELPNGIIQATRNVHEVIDLREYQGNFTPRLLAAVHILISPGSTLKKVSVKNSEFRATKIYEGTISVHGLGIRPNVNPVFSPAP